MKTARCIAVTTSIGLMMVVGALSLYGASARPGAMRSGPVSVRTPVVAAEIVGEPDFFRWAPLEEMPMRTADAAGLSDDSEVIGVVIDGQARAYVTKYLEYPDHVYNDVVGGAPISVAFCEKTSCARVLRREQGDEVRLGGWSGKQLMLFVNGVYWDQMSSAVPLEDQQFERTSWGAWRRQYPQTDVYVGDGGTRRALFGDGPIPTSYEEAGELRLE